jgi:hypothetical protein
MQFTGIIFSNKKFHWFGVWDIISSAIYCHFLSNKEIADMRLRDPKCKTAICVQTKKSLRAFRFSRDSNGKLKFCSNSLESTRLGLRDSSGKLQFVELKITHGWVWEIQMQVLFKLKSPISKTAILFKLKITSWGLTDSNAILFTLINSHIFV